MNKQWIFSICLVIFLMFSFYDWLLHSMINQYWVTKQQVDSLTRVWHKRKTVVLEDKNHQKMLRQWRYQHPHFYQTMQSPVTDNQLFQKIIESAVASGFHLLQANPMSLEQGKQNKIQLVLQGSYLQLFDLISRINELDYPITLLSVEMTMQSRMSCVFLLGADNQ